VLVVDDYGGATIGTTLPIDSHATEGMQQEVAGTVAQLFRWPLRDQRPVSPAGDSAGSAVPSHSRRSVMGTAVDPVRPGW
jgi:hypothetical protein